MRLIRGLGKVLWFELLWKVLILVLVNPLFQDVYQTYVASVGVSFNSGILSTFLSLKGAALFAVLFLAAAGLINSPDYWKAGDYSAENVQALLIKWAASLV